jgi:hypothetical protein
MIIAVYRRLQLITDILAEAVACLADIGLSLFMLPFGTLVALGIHFLASTYVFFCLATTS